MLDKLEVCIKDWAELADEYQQLELAHKEYRSALDQCLMLQKKCVSGVTHQKYRLGAIKKLVSEMEREGGATKEELGEVKDLQKDILRRSAQLEQMQTELPTKSGRYLRGIIGNVDCSILDKNEKYQYKEQCEGTKGVKRPAPESCSDGAVKERRTVIVKRPTKSVASVVKGNVVVDINSLKVAELKQELIARGLPKSGNKSVLVSRLQAYLAEDHQNPHKRKK